MIGDRLETMSQASSNPSNPVSPKALRSGATPRAKPRGHRGQPKASSSSSAAPSTAVAAVLFEEGSSAASSSSAPAPRVPAVPTVTAACQTVAEDDGVEEEQAELIALLRRQLLALRSRCAHLEARVDSEGAVLLAAHKRMARGGAMQEKCDRLAQHGARGREWFSERLVASARRCC